MLCTPPGRRSHSPRERRRPQSRDDNHTSIKPSLTEQKLSKSTHITTTSDKPVLKEEKGTSKSTHITTTSDKPVLKEETGTSKPTRITTTFDKVRPGTSDQARDTDASSVSIADLLDRTKKSDHMTEQAYQQTKDNCTPSVIKSELPIKPASCTDSPREDVTPNKLVHNRQSLSTTPLHGTTQLYRDETPPAELVEASQFLAEGQFSEWYREKFQSNPFALQRYIQHYYQTTGDNQAPVDEVHMTGREDHMIQEESRVTAPQDRLMTSDGHVTRQDGNHDEVRLLSDRFKETQLQQAWWNALGETNIRAAHMLQGLHTDRLPPPSRPSYEDPLKERNQPSTSLVPPRSLFEDPHNQPSLVPPRSLFEDPHNQPTLVPPRSLFEDSHNQPTLVPPRPLFVYSPNYPHSFLPSSLFVDPH